MLFAVTRARSMAAFIALVTTGRFVLFSIDSLNMPHPFFSLLTAVRRVC